MTVQATPNFIDFVGDGVVISFPFTFRADNLSDVNVDFVTDFDQFILNIDQDTNPGGVANYLVAPPLAQAIHIQRATPLTQQLDYTRYDAFDSESHEDALDKLTMEIQDLQQTLADLVGNGTTQGSLLRFDSSLAVPGYREFGPGIGEFLLPTGDGSVGQILQTDGAGQISFVSFIGGGGVTFPLTLLDNEEIQFGAGTDVRMSFDGANFLVNAVGATNLAFTGYSGFATFIDLSARVIQQSGVGAIQRFLSPTGTQGVDITNDETHIVWTDSGGGGLQGPRFDSEMSLFIQEKNAAYTTPVGVGQFWVQSNAPNTPMFTDDTGASFNLIGSSTLQAITVGGDTTNIGIGIRTGAALRVLGGLDTEAVSISNNATYLEFDDTGAGGMEGMRLNSGIHLFILEQAAANPDVAAYGQFWVRNDVPNVPMFTNDTGVDHVLNSSSGIVGSVINSVVRYDGANFIEETQVQVSSGGVLSIHDATLADSISISHSGVSSFFAVLGANVLSFTGPTLQYQFDNNLSISGSITTTGGNLIIALSAAGTEGTQISHDGTDALIDGVGATTDMRFVGISGAYTFESDAVQPMLITGTVNSSYTLNLDNNSNGTLNSARIAISSGDANAALFVAGSGRTSTLVTGGPTGAQVVLRGLGSYPLILGTSNTQRFRIDGNGDMGFFGQAPAPRPTVTGSRAGNVALADLLTDLAGLGLIIDSSVV